MDSLQVQTSHRTTLSGLPTSRSRPNRNTLSRRTTFKCRSITEILSRDGRHPGPEVPQKFLSRDEQPQGPDVPQTYSLEIDILQVQKSHRNTISRWTTSRSRSPTEILT
ncbi:hypothetical protein DPMN_187771 [Dreissena polymorpha]|uniref:Uncharacterized protein n=1 Tax=Dreissena polymorpha TaxID=45954 RepID=A0A9D4DRQ2_DREPO|nr:hypothetical protein DPMN_187771 [Dreissena polymorpha]